MIHELKIAPKYFEAVIQRDKMFELRKDDRGFSVNDTVVLREYQEGAYTGREVQRFIRYILRDCDFGLMPGYCILGF